MVIIYFAITKNWLVLILGLKWQLGGSLFPNKIIEDYKNIEYS